MLPGERLSPSPAKCDVTTLHRGVVDASGGRPTSVSPACKARLSPLRSPILARNGASLLLIEQ